MRLIAVCAAAIAVAGCTSAKTAARVDPSIDEVERAEHWPSWPVSSVPAGSPVFVRNALVVPAPPERVWSWLVRADLWPGWFKRATHVRFESGGPALGVGSVVVWRMLGATIRVTVRQSEAGRRLDWEGGAGGVHAYHAWRLDPVAGGTRIITEETERGPVPSLLKLYLRGALKDAHQEWLESLAKVAGTADPPPPTIQN
jgi:hypothetical protein